MGWLLLVAVAVLGVLVIGVYNSLVRLRVQSENAWADIDVQLKRRYDLIPNLIETVKGYASHEKQTLDAVIAARNRAMAATTPVSKAEAEGILAQSLNSLLALADAYSQWRAIESFTPLQGTLQQIEDAVQNARRYYNAVVRDLNTKIQEFPSNFIANFFSFKPRESFEIAEPAKRVMPKVSVEQAARKVPSLGAILLPHAYGLRLPSRPTARHMALGPRRPRPRLIACG
jgi:LemA protein